jgi:hypothetical protein
MAKKAYISIEGNQAKVFINRGNVEEGEFYNVNPKELSEFIKEKGIKEAVIAQFIPNLISFQVSLPFASKIKNKKLLSGIVMAEIRKRYPAMQNFSFIYNLHETAGRAYLRCYVADEESLSFVNKIILEGVNVIAFYPLFLPLIEFIKTKSEKIEEAQIICLFSDNLRMFFVLQGDEMFLQRSLALSASPQGKASLFEAEEKNLTDEDVININMTVSYAVQNLRIKPEKVIFIGIKKQEIEGLTIPFEFIEFSPNMQNYAVPVCLKQFEKKLTGNEIFLPEYKRYLQNRKYLNYASFVLLLFAFSLIIYNFSIFSEIDGYRKTLNSYRIKVSAKEKDFFILQDSIKNFEKNLKPYIELQRRFNSFGDVRAPIEPLGEASKIKGVEINSIDIENGQPQKIKISGKITGMSFTERQQGFTEFKNISVSKGLKITNEKWDLTKGEFALEGNYDAQRFLQK